MMNVSGISNALFCRSTLKRQTKVTFCLPVRCRSRSSTLWCHWFSFCRACFGFSCWKNPRKPKTFLQHETCDQHSFLIPWQAYRIPNSLHYERFGLLKIVIANVPLNQLSLHWQRRRTYRSLGNPILCHSFVSTFIPYNYLTEAEERLELNAIVISNLISGLKVRFFSLQSF